MRQLMLILSACLLASSAQASADSPRPAPSPANADSLARSDLSSVLKLEHGFEPRMMRDLGGIQFATASYGVDYAGLCRHDTLVLKYVPRESRDDPYKPYGVETTAWFADAGMTDDPADRYGYIPAPACQALDSQKDIPWFSAKDGAQAAQAILVVRKVRAGLNAGTLKPECGSIVMEAKGTTCEAAILAPSFTAANACSAPKGLLCLEFWTGDAKRVTVVFQRSGAEPSPGNYVSPVPGAIQSVALDEFLIVH